MFGTSSHIPPADASIVLLGTKQAVQYDNRRDAWIYTLTLGLMQAVCQAQATRSTRNLSTQETIGADVFPREERGHAARRIDSS